MGARIFFKLSVLHLPPFLHLCTMEVFFSSCQVEPPSAFLNIISGCLKNGLSAAQRMMTKKKSRWVECHPLSLYIAPFWKARAFFFLFAAYECNINIIIYTDNGVRLKYVFGTAARCCIVPITEALWWSKQMVAHSFRSISGRGICILR